MSKVESLRHKDKRANIPTGQLRGFVAEEEEHAAGGADVPTDFAGMCLSR
jgi:hypothetical protein